jgi:hypothetical protein
MPSKNQKDQGGDGEGDPYDLDSFLLIFDE